MMNVENLVKTIEMLVPDMEVTVNKVQKGNAILTGISIGNREIRPTVYVEYYEDVFEEGRYLAVAKEMIRTCKEAKGIGNFDVQKTTTWEYAKDNLRLCISPKETNKNCVVYPYLDLELYVRVIVDINDSGVASYKVKNEMLESWGITTKELLDEAMYCMKPLYNVKSMGETMYEMTGETMFLDEPFPMIVAKTTDGYNGASIIYCKEILKEVADKYESDLIIIPSSIHECILKTLDGITLEEVSKMVKEVNANEVDPTEVLSDHAYIFHRDTMEITW